MTFRAWKRLVSWPAIALSIALLFACSAGAGEGYPWNINGSRRFW